MRRAGEVVLLSSVMLFGITFLWSLRGLNFEAQLFPFLISCVMLVLSTTRLMSIVRTGRAAAPGPSAGSGIPAAGLGRMSPVLVWSWAGGTVVAMISLGFVAATALSVFVYPFLAANEEWTTRLFARSLGTAAIVALFVFVVFTKIMHIDLG